MKRRHLRIYRKRRKKKTLILILICILLIGIAAAERIGYIDMEQFISNKQEAIPYQKVSKTAEENTEKYYYRQLPEEQKQVYREILEGVRNHTEEIYVHDTDADETNQIFRKLMKDQPDIFWCDGTATATTHKGTESYTVLKPKYFYTAKESQTMQTEITQAAAKWLAGLDADADEYQKILYVYEKIVDEVDYDESAPDNQNIYSALVGKRSVCAGYAKSCQYLLEQLGISCIYVTGQTTDPNGEVADHAWNIVQCDGKYYYVDATWGDPIFLGEEGEYQLPDLIAYDYLCCSEKELEKTHTLNTDYDYPVCDSEDLNYYQLNGMYYDEFEPGQMREAICRSIENQKAYTIFKMSDDEIYQQTADEMHGSLMNEGARYLGELYGLYQVSYSYSEEASLDKFIIYWFYE